MWRTGSGKVLYKQNKVCGKEHAGGGGLRAPEGLY